MQKWKNTYYGVLTPEGLIFWVGQGEYQSWSLFFRDNPHHLPLSEAIKAYKAIGYKCVEFTINKFKEVK